MEAISPPPYLMGIAPLGASIFEHEEVVPKSTAVIDTLGYTYLTLFIEVNRAATLTLAEVSQDGVKWRTVDGLVKTFEDAGRAFVNLNEAIAEKEVLMYRYLKFKVDSDAPVVITFEIASKLIDMLPILQQIRDALLGVPLAPEKIKEIVKVPAAVPAVSLDPLLNELKEIHKLLKTRFTNPDTWTHDQKNVTTPGTPVQLAPLPVPDGYALVIRAKSGNAGNIYHGNTKETTLDAAKRVSLAANDTNKLYVKKASEVWIDADNAGEGIEYWCEKRK